MILPGLNVTEQEAARFKGLQSDTLANLIILAERQNNQLSKRVEQLIDANNSELEKRRKFEAEANQEYCEKLLLRNEVMRLRESHSKLAGFIEECHGNSGDPVPGDIATAMDAVFPKEAGEADEEMNS